MHTKSTQAIVDGDPPDLPANAFSTAAIDFVRGALNKIPKSRPTYAMLLRHPWLLPLAKPATIAEENEENSDFSGTTQSSESDFHDAEVAHWVLGALESKKVGSIGKKAKPALHAAPLNSVPSPHAEKIS